MIRNTRCWGKRLTVCINLRKNDLRYGKRQVRKSNLSIHLLGVQYEEIPQKAKEKQRYKAEKEEKKGKKVVFLREKNALCAAKIHLLGVCKHKKGDTTYSTEQSA